VRQSQLADILTEPHKNDFATLRDWLNRPDYGSSFLRSRTEGVWDTEKGFDDFATLKSMQTSTSGFTALIARMLLSIQRVVTQHKRSADHVYSLTNSSQDWIANGIMTIASSVFPVLPIVILFFINRLLVRLGLILVFTAVFAAVLVFGMRMTPDKVLAITTA
jgi:hypothetical protein